MKLDSIFGVYSQRLQVLIDTSLNRFATNVYPQFFDWSPAQLSLSYSSIAGEARIEAAASVVDRGATTPLRNRPTADKLTGTIPAIREMMTMKEEDYRDVMTLQAMPVSDETKRNQMLDFLFNDVKRVGDSAHLRLDIFALEGLSTGEITLNTTNNPDGTILTTAIDLLMPAGNKTTTSIDWATAATAKPLTDITNIKRAYTAKGIDLAEILMSETVFNLFRATKEVTDTLAAYFFIKGSGGAIAISTLDNINGYLSAQRLPQITIIEKPIGIEKDGVIGSINPFKQDVIVLKPAGKIGTIKHALAIEQMHPVAKVNYGIYQRSLISKWSSNEPFQEFTKVELNAMPSFDNIKYCHILKVTDI